MASWAPGAVAGGGEDRTVADAIRSQDIVGLRAPACELSPLAAEEEAPGTGSRVEPATFVRNFEGRVVLVDFWASWCPTCERGLGFLNELAREFRDAGLEVLAINLDTDRRDALDFLAGRRIEFEVARDATGRCPRGFGLVGMPSSYLIDRAGRVRAVTRGFRPGEARAMRAEIAGLLVSTPSALPAVAAGPPSTEPSRSGPVDPSSR